MNKKKSIAIIGAGISGLSSAYHLHNDFEVSLFEKEDYFGGHTDTHDLEVNGESVLIDSGFIVFCRQYYPNFSAMLDKLGVESQPTVMSFSAHNTQSKLVYNATSLNKLFCQRKNLINPRFYRMLFDLVRFYKTATAVLKCDDITLSVKDYLAQRNYSDAFTQDHLYPMISALWSATPERVEQFPIRHLVEFLHKHGMMKLVFRPDWRVIKNGSSSYIKALQQQLNCEWKINAPVSSVTRTNNNVTINCVSGEAHSFDAVIFATHSDQALALLEQPSEHELDVLGAISYEKNHVVVHTDDSVMPANKQAWASWNTEVPNEFNPVTQRCCTANYWMNLLQGLAIKTNIFTTLNSHHKIDPNKVLVERHYAHPIFTATSVTAQQQKHLIDGKNRSYFVGAYWGWGFHEDGARSAAQTCALVKTDLAG